MPILWFRVQLPLKILFLNQNLSLNSCEPKSVGFPLTLYIVIGETYKCYDCYDHSTYFGVSLTLLQIILAYLSNKYSQSELVFVQKCLHFNQNKQILISVNDEITII